jgi:LPXTG-site transpeptidase (sortase) family protein
MAEHARREADWLAALRLVCGVLVAVGLALGGWLVWFFAHSSIEGRALLTQAQTRIAAAATPPRARGSVAASARCRPPAGAVGELVVPALSLVAPVVQGDGAAQLSDAVGHVPTSVWPGGNGTAVLVAHDVTWFHDLPDLPSGAEIEYVSRCDAFTYRVLSARVVTAGTPVANAPGTLALVTCWPLDALWFTSTRELVLAAQVGGSSTATPVTVPSRPRVPPLAVPASLAAVDTLARNPTPLGALSVAGSHLHAFEESPGPLADAAAVQDVFFAAQRAAEADRATLWAQVAPGVPATAAAPLEGEHVSGFGASLATTLVVSGSRLLGGRVEVQEVLTSGGEWTLTCTEGIVTGRLAVTSWTMAEVG